MAHLPTKESVKIGFARAQELRQPRESRMDQAFRLAMPGRGSFFSSNPDQDIDDVFDETAIVATQEFASRLQSGITPNFSRWAQLTGGSGIPAEERPEVDVGLDEITVKVFETLDQSNFGTESYEAYLDLSVTLGCLEVEKGTVDRPAMFNAVPVTQLWVENGPFDEIDKFYRLRTYTIEALLTKYPQAEAKFAPEKLTELRESGKANKYLEYTGRDWSEPNDFLHHRCVIALENDGQIVASMSYRGRGSSPMIAFRWSKAAGETWGRGPLMNALPAIKTCNLVVQMILENAQMSIAGMYNLDDDGTINVDTIQLVPGTIIPRTPGTQGLTPISPGGDFNVAQLILEDMRSNIKRALYNDMLGNPTGTPMSATEVAERMADLARQIGAAFGRLQSEFVTPLLHRVIYILKELKIIELPQVDGKIVRIAARSPLAQAQNQMDITNVDRLVGFVQERFGPQLANVFIKGEEVAKYVGEKLEVPKKLIRTEAEMKQIMSAIGQMQQQATDQAGAPVEDAQALA